MKCKKINELQKSAGLCNVAGFLEAYSFCEIPPSIYKAGRTESLHKLTLQLSDDSSPSSWFPVTLWAERAKSVHNKIKLSDAIRITHVYARDRWRGEPGQLEGSVSRNAQVSRKDPVEVIWRPSLTPSVPAGLGSAERDLCHWAQLNRRTKIEASALDRGDCAGNDDDSGGDDSGGCAGGSGGRGGCYSSVRRLLQSMAELQHYPDHEVEEVWLHAALCGILQMEPCG